MFFSTENEEEDTDRSYYGFCHLFVYLLTGHPLEKGKELISVPKELGYPARREHFSYIICTISVGSWAIEALNLICLVPFHLDSIQTHRLQLAESGVGNQSLHYGRMANDSNSHFSAGMFFNLEQHQIGKFCSSVSWVLDLYCRLNAFLVSGRWQDDLSSEFL